MSVWWSAPSPSGRAHTLDRALDWSLFGEGSWKLRENCPDYKERLCSK